MAVLALYTIVIALKVLSVASDPVIIASLPNLMRVGNEETVLVSLHHRVEPVGVTVKLKLFENGDEGVISESVVNVGEDAVRAVLYVNPEVIPSVETEEELQRYAYVTVSCPALGFEETKQVLLNYEKGFLFIQTDKPVYTPDQSVKIRVISLDQSLTPSPQKVRVDILTPQDVIVKRSNFEENDMRHGILLNGFFFEQDPMFGNWKIVAHYGKDLSVNRTVEFEVKEYVLPTFSVKIQPPAYILPTTENVIIRVESRYVYGKPVRGRCFMKIGVKEEDEEPIIHHTVGSELNHGGIAEVEIETNILGEDWFEENVDNSLYVEVTVVEDATGHFENASDISAKFVRSPYMFSWKRTMRYFKKGLPYEVKTDLKFMNGKPAPGVRVKVIAAATIQGEQNEMILRGAERDAGDGGDGLEPTEDDTNDKGQVNFRLYVPRRCTNIRILLETVVADLEPRGDNGIDNNARLEFNIPPFESSDGNEFLALRVSNQNIRPGRGHGPLHVDVFINAVTAAPVLHFFVISRGKLMGYGKKAIANVDGFDIQVSYEMVPSARIVAYYISDNEHIISDSTWIEIVRECENPLHVTPYEMSPRGDVTNPILAGAHISPQEQISLRVTGTPGTSVALLAVDQAVLLLRDYHRLTPDKMYGSMDEHDTGCGPGGGRNSADVFMNAGLMVVTNLDLNVPRRAGPICAVSAENNRRKRSLSSQFEEDAWNNMTSFACKRGEIFRGQTCNDKVQRFLRVARERIQRKYQGLAESSRVDLVNEMRRVFIECCRGEGENVGRVNGIDLSDPRFIVTEASDVQIRNDFRESWAFDIIDIPDGPQDGVPSVDQPYSVPGSITTWSLQAFGLHNTLAMCVLNPVDLLVFKKVFIQLHMPYSVVRKEFVEIQATVFNYDHNTLVVQMYIEVPDEICSEGLPGELSAMKEFKVKGNDAETMTYLVVGLETGEFPIKVAVLTPLSSDVVEKKLRVVPEGVVKTFQHSTILNPTGAKVDANIQDRHQNETLECDGVLMENDGTQRNCLEINLPDTAVPDSASCFVSVTGNPLGPILTSVISGLESWIRLPSGCGEQTMIRLAPNVYVLRYLNKTESGTDADKNRALSNVQSGITRELTFRHADGSYSAWVHRPSSTWLTAFVGKVFCQASEFTFVDTKGSCGAIKWLTTVQRGDGAFVEGLAVIHKEMSGGVQGDAALTAFALIAMSECRCAAEVQDLASSSSRATVFLENQLNTIQRPYVVAIVTYALALVQSNRRFDANNMLQSLATYDAETGTRYWGTDASSLNPGSRPYWYQRRPSAISVETTGYALLAQLVLGEISYSHPIVKWLSQQQNYGGGFVSTQDTVIALQALSEYATLNTGGNLDMYCNVTAPENFKTVLRLQEGEALVQKTQRVPPRSIRGKLMIKTGGEGVGQLNVEVKYNDLAGNSDADCRFDLSISSERIDGEEGTPFTVGDKVRIRVCSSYLGEEQTSMAILDVGLYSGFAPVPESLQNLVGGDGLIERTERSERSVIFYADHIPTEADIPLCFEFEAVCEIKVGNIQHAAVHVYDYYDPAEECTKFYAPEGTNLLGTLCSNEGVCSCVSSKCAACSGPDGETTDNLLDIACATADTYVYKIVVSNIERQNGFNIITAMVEIVIKRGDDHEVFENVERKFWVSSSCDCPDMRPLRKYLVIGRSYLRYEEEVGLHGYKYIIDHTATVRWWRKGRRFSRYLSQVYERIRDGNSNCG